MGKEGSTSQESYDPYCLVVFLIWFVLFFSCSVGIVLPVYSTFKAIEKKDNSEQQRWLIYWAGSALLFVFYSHFTFFDFGCF